MLRIFSKPAGKKHPFDGNHHAALRPSKIIPRMVKVTWNRLKIGWHWSLRHVFFFVFGSPDHPDWFTRRHNSELWGSQQNLLKEERLAGSPYNMRARHLYVDFIRLDLCAWVGVESVDNAYGEYGIGDGAHSSVRVCRQIYHILRKVIVFVDYPETALTVSLTPSVTEKRNGKCVPWLNPRFIGISVKKLERI
jgi:hypothetical protein